MKNKSRTHLSLLNARPAVLLTSLVIGIMVSRSSFAVVAQEKKWMDEARTKYAQGQLNQALELYNKIPQTSDYWVESIEEKAWTHLRKAENDKALSTITTLTSDFLAPQVGPEAYFLRALIDYRLCNIKGIFQDFELFKKRMQERNEQLEALSKTQSNKSTEKALKVLKSKGSELAKLKADDFGSDIQYLPRYFYRDRTVLAAARTGSDRRVLLRLSQLAAEDAKEIELILQKMHLLESQVVQQVFAYNKQMHDKREAKFSKEDKNSLVFPVKPNGDLWIDEIDSFEAATTDCPVDPLKGATL